ncbi:uncharacterized protein LOC127855574 [Dreissena polymorpha]|uniref:Phospholipase A2-like central domain-containing protein n=1 Tax=Dreissena polymorpha TaxID=45954 RepID=A0A9D4S5P2_DREPO|nr:uncharacterized protein LOC127855574 [Dreissena polymorpha]KAH3891570.1 hypothetical protein DPMN_015674 [Dreissena polymorpha]
MKHLRVYVVIFGFISYIFVRRFGKDRHEELIQSLGRYKPDECPAGIALYRLATETTLYKVQIQEKFPHDVSPETKFLKHCSYEDFMSNGTNLLKEYREGMQSVDTALTHLLRQFCSSKSEEVVRDSKEAFEENSTLAYLLEVVKGPEARGPPDLETTSYYTMTRGIFPGTLWCGFGNIAEDTYGKLGEHSETDDCCRRHDLCKPIIKAFQERYFYSNPSVFPISHCGCDVMFYDCLLKADSSTSKMIGRIFFNHVKMKCFDYDVRDVCVSTVFGLCTEKKQKCVAVLKSNKIFPT